MKSSRKNLERSSLKKMKFKRNKIKSLLKTLKRQKFIGNKQKKPANLIVRKNKKNRRPKKLSSNKKLRRSNF